MTHTMIGGRHGPRTQSTKGSFIAPAGVAATPTKLRMENPRRTRALNLFMIGTLAA